MVSIRMILACFLLCSLWPAALYALQPQPAQLPIDPGEAVATCFSGLVNNNNSSQGLKAGPNDFVVGFANVSDPLADGVSPGANWLASMFHNELANQSGVPDPTQVWNAANLGQVFGITLDAATPPNIYITATTTYGLFKNSTTNQYLPGMFGPGGPGAVYRLDGGNGKISTFAVLPKAGIGTGPNSGPGLGDIAYDKANRQFFVSDFDGGLIYRLAGVGHVSGLPPGTMLDTYDHGAINLGLSADTSGDMCPSFRSANKAACAANPTNPSGFTPLGRRPWAVQVFGGRLFYSIWANDSRTLPATQNGAPNEVWSVPINPVTGDLVTTAGAAKKEISLSQPLYKDNTTIKYSNPVSDIAFSAGGRMLVAERTMSNGDVGWDVLPDGRVGHRARVLEFQGSTGNWGPEKVFHTGGATGIVPGIRANSEGGVDYSYEIFNYPPGTPAVGRACDQSVWATAEAILESSSTGVYGLQGIRASGNSFTPIKTDFAVDLNGILTSQDKARIGDVEVARHSCFESCLRIADVQARCVDDRSGDVLVTFQLTNLTSGPIHHLFITNLPAGVTTPDDHFPFSTPVAANGGTATVGPIRIHNAPPGPLSFTISIHDANLIECCATDVTIEIPTCDCGQILEDDACVLLPQTFDYTFTFQDLLQQASAPHVFVIPVSPANITVSPNVFPASPALQYGDTLTGTATISGPGAVLGQKVCLRISTHDAAFRECCAIDRCFTLARSCGFGPFTDFDVNVVWRDSKGQTGSGKAVRLTDDSAYFWFFAPENVELVVKILDGRAINGNWWFFYGALSNVEYTMTLRDKTTGASKTYFNPAGRFASVGDTAALPGSTAAVSPARAVAAPELVDPLGSVAGACSADLTHLCLSEGRFKVEVTWKDSAGRSSSGQAVPLTRDTGYFWFFGANNVELVIKILDGRALNGHWWVFYASLSNVQYTITVIDTITGAVKTYSNPAGSFASMGDTTAF